MGRDLRVAPFTFSGAALLWPPQKKAGPGPAEEEAPALGKRNLVLPEPSRYLAVGGQSVQSDVAQHMVVQPRQRPAGLDASTPRLKEARQDRDRAEPGKSSAAKRCGFSVDSHVVTYCVNTILDFPY